MSSSRKTRHDAFNNLIKSASISDQWSISGVPAIRKPPECKRSYDKTPDDITFCRNITVLANGCSTLIVAIGKKLQEATLAKKSLSFSLQRLSIANHGGKAASTFVHDSRYRRNS